MYLLLVTMAVLCAATVTCTALRARAGAWEVSGGRSKVDNFADRVRSWWIMAPVIFAALFAGPAGILVLTAICSLQTLREFLAAAPGDRTDHAALAFVFYVLLPLQYGLVWAGWGPDALPLVPIAVTSILPVLLVLEGRTTDLLSRSARLATGCLLCVYGLAHLPAIGRLEGLGWWEGVGLAGFAIFVIQISDALQYAAGSAVGRHRIAPTISPSKTWEGLAAGLMGTMAFGAFLHGLTPFSPTQAALLALAASASGFLGGVAMSAIKRDLGIKDWGSAIGGHGGYLDRLDSTAFAAPVLLHLMSWLLAA